MAPSKGIISNEAIYLASAMGVDWAVVRDNLCRLLEKRSSGNYRLVDNLTKQTRAWDLFHAIESNKIDRQIVYEAISNADPTIMATSNGITGTEATQLASSVGHHWMRLQDYLHDCLEGCNDGRYELFRPSYYSAKELFYIVLKYGIDRQLIHKALCKSGITRTANAVLGRE